MRRRSPGGADVRAAFLEQMRESASESSPNMQDYFGRYVAKLEADGPVVVRRWQLNGVLPDGPRTAAEQHLDVCIEPDGSVSPVERLSTGVGVTDYRRPDGSLVFGKATVDA